MLGVAALIAVMSVMNGFRAELFDKIIGLNGHAVVQGYGGRLDDWREVRKQALATPGVTEALPLIEQPLMASFGGRSEERRVGKECAVRVDLGGRRIIQKKKVNTEDALQRS